MTVIVTTPEAVIRKQILFCMRDYMNTEIPSLVPGIQSEVKDLTKRAIQVSSTYNSLISGALKGHFGFVAGTEQKSVDAIVNVILQNLRVKFNPIRVLGNQFRGGIVVRVLREGFDDLLKQPDSIVIDPKNGNVIPWLEWLLLEGDSIIITDFVISFSSSPFSRSGDAIMIEKVGGTWKVPSTFSGTVDDNWLTRALSEPAYLDAIGDILERQLRTIE